jgi:hypothetical protein
MPLDKLELRATCGDRSAHRAHRYMLKIATIDYLETRICDILQGIRAPAAASTDWPPVVQCGRGKLPLLKSCDSIEGDVCCYQYEPLTEHNPRDVLRTGSLR